MDKIHISEIALRCGDIDFKDFDSTIYERSLLKATRKLARKYELIQRIREFNVSISIPENEDEDSYVEEKVLVNVPLDLMSFKAEYKVLVNGYNHTKVNVIHKNQYEYVLYRDQNQILFNYSPRTKDDKVILYYTADINIDDYDIEELQPVIPSSYEEELLDLGTVIHARLGVVKFKGSDKGNGYREAISMYSKNDSSLDRNLTKNQPWTVITPWSAL